MTKFGDLLGETAEELVRVCANFSISTYRGTISDEETLRLIIETVKESPTVNRRLLKDFGIIK